MSLTLEDLERHLLVKIIDRILYKLGDFVRPYEHKILGNYYFLNDMVIMFFKYYYLILLFNIII